MNVEYLVVGGGGGAGANIYPNGEVTNIPGGGGGGGDVVGGSVTLAFATTYTIEVGGGASHPIGSGGQGFNGGNSYIHGVVGAAGGGGGGCNIAEGAAGANGANGGGGGRGMPGGTGNAGGYNGAGGSSNFGGGGAGDGGPGSAPNNSYGGGNGGVGTASAISGTTRYYGAGGGGAPTAYDHPTMAGAGGVEGGGQAGYDRDYDPVFDIEHRPGRGGTNGAMYGAGGGASAGTPSSNTPGNGFRGVVVIRYAGGQVCSGGTVSSAGGYTIHTFDAAGIAYFTTPQPPPTLTSINPTFGYRGEDTGINLFGTNFINGGTTINTYTNGGMSLASGPYWGDSTLLGAYLRLTQDAAMGGNHLVGVSTAGGFSGWILYSAAQRPPTLTALSINNSGGAGQGAVYVGMTGTQLTSDGFTVNVSGGGVTVSGGPYNGGWTYWEVYLAIASNAAHGMRQLTVTTIGGTSNALDFFVYAVPTITELDNTTLPGTYDHVFRQGTTNIYTHFWGTGLANPSSGSAGYGVDLTFAAFGNETLVAMYVTTAADAVIGPRQVTLKTPGGISNELTITILPQAPTLTSVATYGGGAAQGFVGVKERVTIIGTNFVSGDTTINVSGGITVSNIFVASPTVLYADFTGTAPGSYAVSATTAGGTTTTVGFTVLAVTSLASAGMIVNQIIGASRTTTLATVPLSFTVGTVDQLVTHLGRWRYGGSTATHTIILRDNGGVQLASATVNLSSGTADAWNYTALALPVRVTRGQTYTLEEVGGTTPDTWADISPVATDGKVVINGPVIAGTPSGYSETYVTVNLKWVDGAGQQVAIII